jgi:hypothetical protein
MLLHRGGIPVGIAAAIHGARSLLLDPENDALIATVAPEAYEGAGVRVFGARRWAPLWPPGALDPLVFRGFARLRIPWGLLGPPGASSG